MLSIFFLGTLASAGDTSSAYHPSDAVFYLELPALHALADAYEDAPILRLINDESVARFAAGIAGREAEGFRLGDELLDRIDDQITEGNPAIARAVDAILHAGAVSISITRPTATASVPSGDSEGDRAPAFWNFAGVLTACTFDESETAAGVAMDLAGLLESLGASASSDDESDGQRQVGHTQAFELSIADRKLQAWTHVEGKALFLGLGTAQLRDLQHRLGAPDGSLASDAEFRAGRAQFASGDGTPIYECFIRLRGISNAFLSLGLELEPSVREELESAIRFLFPGDAYESHGRTSLIQGRFVSETVRRAADGGIARALGATPVSAEALALVPEGAVAAWVSSIDASVLEAELSKLLGPSSEAMLAELKERYEFDPLSDLLGALGTHCAVYCHPITGLTASKAHLVVELRDPAAFERGLRGLARFLTDLGESKVRVETRPYRNLPLYTFTPGRDLGDLASAYGAPAGFVAIAPNLVVSEIAITVMGERAIFGLGDMGLKTEIKRLLGETSPKQHALASGQYSLPDDATSVSFLHWGAILSGIYKTLRDFAPLIAQAAEGLPFDPAELPEAEIFSRYFPPTVSWTRRTPGGTYRHEESSLGPEIPAALVALAVGAIISDAMESGRSHARSSVDIQTLPEPAPANAPPATVDPVQHTRETLRDVKLALTVYRTDQGSYPIALQELCRPTERFPNGFLEADSPPPDAWGRALHYERRDDGASFLLWSAGPDGVNDAGAGDDLASR